MDILETIWPKRGTYAGLTGARAKENLLKFGPNSLPPQKKASGIVRLLKIFSEPMMLLILTTAAIYFFIGDETETIIFLLSVVPIGLMEYFQEKRTDQALAMLDKMIVYKTQAYRDGRVVTLDTSQIVPGDLVHLSAGDKIPADGYLLASPGLRIDESVLTGESLSVAKAQLPDKIDLVKDENKLWQGTLVTQGEGKMLVSATGSNTAYGKLGLLVGKIRKGETPLQKKMHRLLRVLAALGVSVAAIVTAILSLEKGMLSGLLGGLTIAMSVIPEEFPVVFSVFLVLGVLRMAKRNALIREMVLAETLGSVSVICADKTGTLTEGRLTMEKIYWQGEIIDLKNNSNTAYQQFFHDTLLALERVAVDPIETETQRYAAAIGLEPHGVYEQYRLIKDVPFEAKTKMTHHLWQDKMDGFFQFSAGAPEYIIERCRFAAGEKEKAMAAYEDAANDGFRVVAVAKKMLPGRAGEIADKDFEFVGLLIMSDPPRPGVKEAIDVCQKAGIRVIMITGDNSLTAHSVAEAIRLKHNENIVSGGEIEKFSPTALRARIKNCNIFARVRPEQKYAIVQALQDAGEVVAMTGDGVNDAPALKKADIGVAMGKRGTEVAREAAGMVLLDDNFATIVKAVREGRRIYDNMQHAFMFLISFHIPIIGLAIMPLMFNHAMIFLPIHIIFLELICDPASVLGFEREPPRRNLMKEKPRGINEPLVNKKMWSRVLLQGVAIFVISFSFYWYFGIFGQNPALGRTAAFTALVLAQIALLVFTREWEQLKTNRLILWIVVLTAVFLTLVDFVPLIRQVFYFYPMSSGLDIFIWLAVIGLMGLVGLITRRMKKI